MSSCKTMLAVTAGLWFWSALAGAGNTDVGKLAALDKPADSDVIQAEIARTTQALTLQPRAAMLYNARGAAHFKLHEFDAAIADFSAALKALDDAYFGRGMALARNGDIEAGIADLSAYIKRHPDSSLAHTKRGVRYLWSGDFAAAERDLSQAIKLDPNNAEAHDDLGVIYAKREDYRGAAQHFATTIKLEPSYQKAYHNLAFVHYLMDEDAQALKAVDGALALGEDRDSLLLRSLILEALGRHTEAQAAKTEAELVPEGNWSERLPIK